MSDEIVPDLSNENNNSEIKEEIINNLEEKLPNPTIPELDDVQSFCAEFHIKVENAAGIRPWLQFSDTNFPGKMKRKFNIFEKKFFIFIEEVFKQFEESEFDMPTPIQSIAWPILSQNRDLVGIASTGSGKTLAVSRKLKLQI
jgi:superfamily II DNA/RNA helicase